MSADNQQERLNSYLSGYVDGEGTFHIAIQKSKNVKVGYQLVPELHVSQNADRGNVLRLLKEALGCGYIKANHPGNTRDKTNVFVVRNRRDLLDKVVPFFERYPILSPKGEDFKKFSYIVREMERGKHLSREGLAGLLKIAFSMNGEGKYRKVNLQEILKEIWNPQRLYAESSGNIRGKI